MLMGMPLMIQPSPTLLSLMVEAGFPFEMINANTKTFLHRVIGIEIKCICQLKGSYGEVHFHLAMIVASGNDWLVGVSK